MIQKNLQYTAALLAILATGCICGCGGETVHQVNVTGKITLDGKPIEGGIIKFLANDGATPSGGGTVLNDGSYVAEVPPGKKKVLIASYKVVGKVAELEGMPDSRMIDKRVCVTPKIYNIPQRTPLEADITDQKLENLDFKLVSNPTIGNSR